MKLVAFFSGFKEKENSVGDEYLMLNVYESSGEIQENEDEGRILIGNENEDILLETCETADQSETLVAVW